MTDTLLTERKRLPYKYVPRSYQKPFFYAMHYEQKKRACIVWHRRAGKEKTCWTYVITMACERVGSYYYFFPTNIQGRKVLWDGMDASGFPFLSHIPTELLDGDPNQTEMKIRLCNGSLIQVIWTDNYDSARGTNPIGCVFSEYSYQDPRVWDTFRPILAENGGWAIFNFTPNGKNHASDLYEMALKTPEWFCQVLTVLDTVREDGTPIITPEAIQAERIAGMDEEMIQQEFYCSFQGIQRGSYYGREMEQAEKSGRITDVPYNPSLPVDTAWDLGIGDSTAIWFVQPHGVTFRVIDHYEASGVGLSHYAKVLQDRGYVYGTHYAPHDIEVAELGTGRSRKEVAAGLGIKFRTVEKAPVEDGIQAVRGLLPMCWFDRGKTQAGRNALIQYHREWDDKRKCFRDRPYHDWASHSSDALRYYAIGYKEAPGKIKERNLRPSVQQFTGNWMS